MKEPSHVPGKLQHFGGEVLQHSGHVDGGANSHSLGMVALLQCAVDASDRELKFA